MIVWQESSSSTSTTDCGGSPSDSSWHTEVSSLRTPGSACHGRTPSLGWIWSRAWRGASCPASPGPQGTGSSSPWPSAGSLLERWAWRETPVWRWPRWTRSLTLCRTPSTLTWVSHCQYNGMTMSVQWYDNVRTMVWQCQYNGVTMLWQCQYDGVTMQIISKTMFIHVLCSSIGLVSPGRERT